MKRLVIFPLYTLHLIFWWFNRKWLIKWHQITCHMFIIPLLEFFKNKEIIPKKSSVLSFDNSVNITTTAGDTFYCIITIKIKLKQIEKAPNYKTAWLGEYYTLQNINVSWAFFMGFLLLSCSYFRQTCQQAKSCILLWINRTYQTWL